MASFAYLRVSTQDQTTDQQMKQIMDAGYTVEPDRVFIEQGVSGKVPALQREQFKRLDDRLAAGGERVFLLVIPPAGVRQSWVLRPV